MSILLRTGTGRVQFPGREIPDYSDDDEVGSVITLNSFLKRTDHKYNDLVLGPKPTFVDLVKERAEKLQIILTELNETQLNSYTLTFKPGCVLEELDSLIARKSKELEKQNSNSRSTAGTLCPEFIEGTCELGSACSLVHSQELLLSSMIAIMMSNTDGYLRIATPLGKEAFFQLMQLLETTHTLLVHTISCDCFKILCKIISTSQPACVNTIDLSGNSLGVRMPTSLRRMATSFQTNTNITSLLCDRNELGPKGILTILQALSQNTALTSISLQDNNLNCEGEAARSRHIVDILSHSCIQYLYLSQNPLGLTGVQLLLNPYLNNNNWIKSLDLFGCKIGDDGINELIEGLKETSSLTNLNIGWNAIGDAIIELSEWLAEDTNSITHLNLSCNPEISKTPVRLGDVIRSNTKLVSLDLRWTFPHEDTIQSILDALSANGCLCFLDASNCNLDRRVTEKIKEKLRRRAAVNSSQQ